MGPSKMKKHLISNIIICLYTILMEIRAGNFVIERLDNRKRDMLKVPE